MAHPSHLLTKLYASGKYSDLVLQCAQQEFKVHRSVVCTTSPVLAAAIDHFKVLHAQIISMSL